jgi:hypothetical protein
MRRTRPSLRFCFVHALALIVVVAPLLAALAELDSSRGQPGQRPELAETASPGPGPSLSKSGQPSAAVSSLAVKYVPPPDNLRRHSGRAPHALVCSGVLRFSTLQSSGVRLQI